MMRRVHLDGGEISGELLADLRVIPNGHGITDIDELFDPIERRNGSSRGGLDGRRLVHMEELFIHAPNEMERRARDAMSRNGSDPSRTLARTDIIMSGAGITGIDELFKPIEPKRPRITDQDDLFEPIESDPVTTVESDPELSEEVLTAEIPAPNDRIGRVLHFLTQNVARPESFSPLPEAG